MDLKNQIRQVSQYETYISEWKIDTDLEMCEKVYRTLVLIAGLYIGLSENPSLVSATFKLIPSLFFHLFLVSFIREKYLNWPFLFPSLLPWLRLTSIHSGRTFYNKQIFKQHIFPKENFVSKKNLGETV